MQAKGAQGVATNYDLEVRRRKWKPNIPCRARAATCSPPVCMNLIARLTAPALVSQLRRVLTEEGEPITNDEIDEMFRVGDLDASGNFDFKLYTDLVFAHAPRLKK